MKESCGLQQGVQSTLTSPNKKDQVAICSLMKLCQPANKTGKRIYCSQENRYSIVLLVAHPSSDGQWWLLQTKVVAASERLDCRNSTAETVPSNCKQKGILMRLRGDNPEPCTERASSLPFLYSLTNSADSGYMVSFSSPVPLPNAAHAKWEEVYWIYFSCNYHVSHYPKPCFLPVSELTWDTMARNCREGTTRSSWWYLGP